MKSKKNNRRHKKNNKRNSSTKRKNTIKSSKKESKRQSSVPLVAKQQLFQQHISRDFISNQNGMLKMLKESQNTYPP
jgi:hypothetical protein